MNDTDNKLRLGLGTSRLQEPAKSGARTSRQGKFTAGVPLAKLIKRRLANAPEIVMLHQTRSAAAEKFRRLKTVLANASKGSPQVIVVTSAGPGEGKSLTSINLALAFAADKLGRVLLLDADLRRPSIGKWLSPAPNLGLSELLDGKMDLDHAVLQLSNSALNILPAGSPPADPVELLSSDYARVVISTLRKRFQRVIIDTPPILPFTDADVLGVLSDGVVLVARAGQTRKSMLLQAISAVTSTRILGTVLNDSTFSLADRQTYYHDREYYKYFDRESKK